MYDQCCCCLVTQSCSTLCHPCKIPQAIGFSRKDYWSGLPLPPPGDLPNPGIKLVFLLSPALVGRFFTTEPPEKPINNTTFCESWGLVTPFQHYFLDEPLQELNLAGLWLPFCPLSHLVPVRSLSHHPLLTGLPWSLPWGSWYFLINLPNHSHCHITIYIYSMCISLL